MRYSKLPQENCDEKLELLFEPITQSLGTPYATRSITCFIAFRSDKNYWKNVENCVAFSQPCMQKMRVDLNFLRFVYSDACSSRFYSVVGKHNYRKVGSLLSKAISKTPPNCFSMSTIWCSTSQTRWDANVSSTMLKLLKTGTEDCNRTICFSKLSGTIPA